MEILEHVSNVQSALQEDTSSAMRLMAEGILDFLDEDVLIEAMYNPQLAEMFDLATGIHEAHLPKALRKDRRKMDRMKATLAPHYSGVPERVAAWGHEAHAEGLRAFGMDRSAKASPKLKVRAHHDANQAHRLAAHHLGQAGHKKAAELHMRAADYHSKRKAALVQQHGVSAEESKNERIENEIRKAATGKVGIPTLGRKPRSTAENIESWLGDIDEAEGYHPDAKKATQVAFGATAHASKENATSDQHITAHNLHKIASGVAKAHGHVDIAKKHADKADWHKDQAAKVRASSSAA